MPMHTATAALETLTELLDSIESSAAILRLSLEEQLLQIRTNVLNSNTKEEGMASAPDLPFHISASLASHASKVRVAAEKLAQLVTPPRHIVFEAAGSFYITAALDIIVKSDIASVIHDKGTRDAKKVGIPVEVLAQETRLDSDLLARLLRHLVANGIFEEITVNKFANNAASQTLVHDPEFRAHLDLVMHEGRAAIAFFPELISKRFENTASAASLSGTPATTTHPLPPSAFSLYSHGQRFYDWLHSPEHSDRNTNFNVAMRGMALTEGLAFLPADYPFYALPPSRLIVDVGGGLGSLPALLLPSLQAQDLTHTFIVQDLEPVIRQATLALKHSMDPISINTENMAIDMEHWMAQGRIQFCIQDCFQLQPPELEGSTFILKNMIHNYPDSQALCILLNLRKSHPYKLLIIDRLVLPQLKSEASNMTCSDELLMSLGVPDFQPSQRAPTFYDLVMASLHGGKNRTVHDWCKLLASAGFQLEQIWYLRASTGQAVIECTCV
ncbi:hypothetical protein FB446DRAFT_747496 [Lentinula raphanica]|nr:hypothetical protein FB446DRAFT_747496 [Lentinula raphanica]